MGEPLEKSCYVVETSVGPGGSRWAELHAYTDLAHVRRVIDWFCGDTGGTNPYHGIHYGAVLGVWTIQRGVVKGFVDLHPFIEVKLGDKEALRLSDNDACRALVKERRKEIVLAERAKGERDEDDDDDDLDYDWHETDMDVFAEIRMKADWEAIAAHLSPLEPPLLQSGERAKQDRPPGVDEPEDGYFYLNGNIRFGSYEVENGETLEGPIPFKELLADPEDEEDEEEENDEDEGED